MTRCNHAILPASKGRTNWPRFCHLPVGHEGRHRTRYLGEWLEFDGPERAA